MNTTAVDARKIAAMRLILAASGLLVIWIDPTQPDRLVRFTYVALSAYTLYSAILYFFSHTDRIVIRDRWAHWADVAWYALLISLSNGTGSIFFFGFFLAVVSASFRWGFASGVRTTIVATLAFSVVGLTSDTLNSEFELDRFLLRSVYLPVIGYMIAYWGGQEVIHKKRLALLREVATLSNPRFGVGRTIGMFIERLSAFYGGAICALVAGDGTPRRYLLYRSGSNREVGRPDDLTTEIGELLMALSDEQSFLFTRRHRWQFWLARVNLTNFGAVTYERNAADIATAERLAAFFGAESFVSVPVRQAGTTGHLYLVSAKGAYNETDVQLLLQIIEQVAPVIQNIYLVDRLASDAAEAERQKIARDIHDSVIQPYIGLQMALSAVREKWRSRNHEGVEDIDRVLQLAQAGVSDLRTFVLELTGEQERQPSLMPAVARFIEKFTEATGIRVEVVAPERLFLNDRLAAEVFQIIAEGLSNVRKHTNADHARIFLAEQRGQLLIRIENDSNIEAASFIPRSISGRATALGGTALVEQDTENRTIVSVKIPL